VTQAGPRCSDAARERADPLFATAPPAVRLLLIEVPGPWGRAGLVGSRLPDAVTRPLAAAADAGGVRVQLLRAVGRHAVPRVPGAADGGGHSWALADPDAGVVRWGTWTAPDDLLAIDLHERLHAGQASTGPQRLALVCTHARHDVCCAVRGRPVAAVLAEASDHLHRQIWETSHLGGDRFAANVLLLPEGEVFGGLDDDTVVDVVRAVDVGRLDLTRHRGRVGRAPVVQAALHLAALTLGDDRLGAVRAVGRPRAASGEDGRISMDVVRTDRRYTVTMVESWAPPRPLTCAALEAKPARRFALESITEIVPVADAVTDAEEDRRAG